MTVSARTMILRTVADLVEELLWSGRKSDPDLPRGAIEFAIVAGEITEEEIVQHFKAKLREGLR